MPFNRVKLAKVRESLYDRAQEVPWAKVIKHLVLPLILLVFISGFAAGIVEAAAADWESAAQFVLFCAIIIPPFLMAAGLVDRIRRAIFEPADIFSSLGYGLIFTAKVLLLTAWYDLIAIAAPQYESSLAASWGWFAFQVGLLISAVAAVVLYLLKDTPRLVIANASALRPSS